MKRKRKGKRREREERRVERKREEWRRREERRKRCWWIAKMELGEGLVHLSYEYLPTCR